MTTLYLDTSALVKLYVEEEGRETVFEAVEEAGSIATSTVAYAEARAAFARKERIGDLRAGEMAERYALRGFDALHLASAFRLGERFADVRLLAFDDRLVEAARAASVPVFGET